MKKFELTTDFITVFGIKLFRIKALVEFGTVKAGELGGYIEKEENLDHDGDAWVSGDAQVYGDAQVCGNARVCGDARVYGDAQVSGDAWVYGDAQVSGNAWVSGNARVYGDARVSGDAWVSGDARVSGDAWVSGDAQVYGNADYACVKGFGTKYRNTTFFREKDGIVKVSCGCFFGTIPEFRKQVEKTRSGKIAREYLMIADLMEMHFSKDGEHEND